MGTVDAWGPSTSSSASVNSLSGSSEPSREREVVARAHADLQDAEAELIEAQNALVKRLLNDGQPDLEKFSQAHPVVALRQTERGEWTLPASGGA
jgi:hypothetical protein